MLKVTDVAKRFAGRELFSGVSLRAEAGEIVVVVGPSGSGKSTLLAIVGGLLRPDAGGVAYGDGVSVEGVGWVFQSLNLLTTRTVLDNAMSYWVVDGGDRSRYLERAAECLERVGLHQRLQSSARELSGGERQRLNVARVLASNRRLLLLDEPTNQLDRESTRQVMQLLGESAMTGGRLIVVVTHDQDSVPDGRVVRLGQDGLYEQ